MYINRWLTYTNIWLWRNQLRYIELYNNRMWCLIKFNGNIIPKDREGYYNVNDYKIKEYKELIIDYI